MKEKILQEALGWYENQEKKPDVKLEDFVDLVIKKQMRFLMKSILS